MQKIFSKKIKNQNFFKKHSKKTEINLNGIFLRFKHISNFLYNFYYFFPT